MNQNNQYPPGPPGSLPYDADPAQPGNYNQAPAQPAAQQTAPGAVPSYYLPDENELKNSYAEHERSMARPGGDGPQFVKFFGPNGSNWDGSVPQGHESSVIVYIAPSVIPGRNIFRPTRSHFYKGGSKPQGTSVGCPGPETCLICQARDAALAGGDEYMKKRAEDFGRVRKQFTYNVFMLENYQGHFGADGKMRPFVLGAPGTLHKAIGDIFEDRQGAINVVDPVRGRPIRLKKKKVGPLPMDVQYAALAQDPHPLPQEYYPAFENIWDLEKIDRMPTHEDMIQAVQDIGLALPGGAPGQSALAPPNPAYGNPYPGGGQHQSGYNPGPPPQAGFSPQSPQYATQAPGGPGDPAAGYSPPQGYSPPATAPAGPPPNFSPPPVTSSGNQSGYAPQPSQPVAQPPQPGPAAGPTTGPPTHVESPAAPAQPAAAPVRQPVHSAPEAGPVAAGDGRDKCFGKYNETDAHCAECPGDLKTGCIAMTTPGAGDPAASPAPGESLEELQARLKGQ